MGSLGSGWAGHPGSEARAGIVSVVEVGRGADIEAIIEPSGALAAGTPFGEEALTFSDRTHQHNGAAFDEFTGLLSTTGTLVVPLPAYLLGHDYVRFANDARENAGYLATVTTDVPSRFYLLIDNRVNGPAGANTSPNNTDPDLGGTLQWVIDGGWQRVNTGISPNDQPDYTGVDEGGDGFGPGVALNQFYSVWTLPQPSTIVTVSNNGIGGNNMISLVAVPEEGGPVEPIGSFIAAPAQIAPGGTAVLSWFIDPAATSATIEPGIGDILGETNAQGAGSVQVSPAAPTTYTLSVATPTGSESADATVDVRLIESFTADRVFVGTGDGATLSWRVRPDASVEILPDIGSVNDLTGIDGVGSIEVEPEGTVTYVLRATAGEQSAEAGAVVFGGVYAAIDIGGTDGQPEPGAADGIVVGAGPNNTNALDLFPAVPVTTMTGDTLTLAIDSVAPDGFPIGALDWRDRGNAPAVPLARWAEDLVKNNLGMVHVTLGGLPPGAFEVTSFHIDPTFSQGEEILIRVTDALGTDRDTGVIGDASWPGHPENTGAPPVAGLTPELVLSTARAFEVVSDGSDLSIWFDGQFAPLDDETPLAGLVLRQLSVGRPFQIESIQLEDGNVTITWNSIPGRLYVIRASADLSLWEERDDSYPPGGATGESTSYTEPLREDAPVLFYEVAEQQ